ncbi:MAG: DUF2779 domain-containing protein [Ilumatobacteraceae bacterium]
MTTHHLTKSNFKLGVECKQKLTYHKAKYPSTLTDNDMLEFFAEGGFMVEAIAHAVMLHANPSAEFEVTLQHDRFQARVDGWERFPTYAVLTEIKATSVESADPSQFLTKAGEVNGGWRPYLLDVTFQVMVARLAHPQLEIRPRLCVVNKTKPTNLEGIYANIDVVDDKDADRDKPRAVFTGDRASLAADHFLEFIDVSDIVEQLMDEVVEASTDLLDHLDGNHAGYVPERTASLCRSCEFRGDGLSPNGFAACWGPSPTDSPHFLDIHQGYRSKEQKSVFQQMLMNGNYRLVDLPDHVVDAGGSWGPPRRNQVRVAREGREFQDPQLVVELANVTYPIHFIDFEASRIPVPYLAGMKPYEQVAFQFSCHTVQSADSTELRHSQWLNLHDVYPNDEFVRELRNVVGETGTVLVWSHYEKSTLKGVRRQLRERGVLDASLSRWFDGLVGRESVDGEDVPPSEGSRLLDMLQLSKRYYCHPGMNGSHSIKRVLDCVWASGSFLWSDPWFAEYYRVGDDGRPMDPYKTLAASTDVRLDDTFEGDNGADAVTDGVGAMRAYQELIYGRRRGDELYRRRLAESLYRYCGLDTAAMVMIWRYWLTERVTP